MKRRFIYLLPALLVLTIFATGCLKNSNPPPLPYPTGTFNGQFRLLHKKLSETKVDTLKQANIQLVLETGMTFKVLGDTTTVHAGSKGQYGINSAYMGFNDDTYPKTGTPEKIHLHGNYSYIYDGSTLVILAVQGDTINYRYDLKKVN
jgi:hypothetical protein